MFSIRLCYRDSGRSGGGAVDVITCYKIGLSREYRLSLCLFDV